MLNPQRSIACVLSFIALISIIVYMINESLQDVPTELDDSVTSDFPVDVNNVQFLNDICTHRTADIIRRSQTEQFHLESSSYWKFNTLRKSFIDRKLCSLSRRLIVNDIRKIQLLSHADDIELPGRIGSNIEQVFFKELYLVIFKFANC